MSDLLKVKVGGKNYLCKWNKSVIYKMDINNFDINTLKDGNVQWNFYNNDSSNITLQKTENNELSVSIRSSSTRQLNLQLNQFNNIDKGYIIDLEFSIPYLDYTMYAGSYTINLTKSVREFNGVGYWIYKLNTIDLKQGYIDGVFGDWSRIIGFNWNEPYKYRIKIDKINNAFEIYMFDDLIATGTTNNIIDTIGFNNGGSGNGDFIIKKLEISSI